jgi:hypothetical protein
VADVDGESDQRRWRLAHRRSGTGQRPGQQRQGGVYVGRLAVRASGSGTIKTARETSEGIHVRERQPLQRGDSYTCDQKGGVALPPQV